MTTLPTALPCAATSGTYKCERTDTGHEEHAAVTGIQHTATGPKVRILRWGANGERTTLRYIPLAESGN